MFPIIFTAHCKLKHLKNWLNLKMISGVLNESLILLVIFKTIFASYFCISKKVLKNILFLQLPRIKRICNNSDSVILAFPNLVDNAKYNSVLPNLLTAILNC